MSALKWKHRPCPCGCGEMADECMNPRSGLNAFQIETQPGDRDDLVRTYYDRYSATLADYRADVAFPGGAR